MLYINNNNNYKYIHACRPYMCMYLLNETLVTVCVGLHALIYLIVIHDQHSTTCFCDNSVYNPLFFFEQTSNCTRFRACSVLFTAHGSSCWTRCIGSMQTLYGSVILDCTLIKLQCLCLIYVILYCDIMVPKPLMASMAPLKLQITFEQITWDLL